MEANALSNLQKNRSCNRFPRAPVRCNLAAESMLLKKKRKKIRNIKTLLIGLCVYLRVSE